MFVPIRDRKRTVSHRFVRTTFIHTIAVNKDNRDAIAKALGIKGRHKARLKSGSLHVAHEAGKKK